MIEEQLVFDRTRMPERETVLFTSHHTFDARTYAVLHSYSGA